MPVYLIGDRCHNLVPRISHEWKSRRQKVIKVSIFYPNGEGKNFNMDYYCNKHMPMVKQKLGAKLKGVAADKGVSGLQAGSGPSHLAVGHLYFDSVEDFQAAFGPHVAAFMADLPNFTNSTPEVHIFEVSLK